MIAIDVEFYLNFYVSHTISRLKPILFIFKKLQVHFPKRNISFFYFTHTFPSCIQGIIIITADVLAGTPQAIVVTK